MKDQKANQKVYVEIPLIHNSRAIQLLITVKMITKMGVTWTENKSVEN